VFVIFHKFVIVLEELNKSMKITVEFNPVKSVEVKRICLKETSK